MQVCQDSMPFLGTVNIREPYYTTDAQRDHNSDNVPYPLSGACLFSAAPPSCYACFVSWERNRVSQVIDRVLYKLDDMVGTPAVSTWLWGTAFYGL